MKGEEEEFTQVFHGLRKQSLESVEAATLGVQSFGQGVAQMHLVLEKKPRRGRRCRGGAGRIAGAGRRRRRRRLFHVGIAVARAGRRGVAHVIEEDVVRRWRARIVRKGSTPPIKVQVKTPLQILAEGIGRKAPRALLVVLLLLMHRLVVHARHAAAASCAVRHVGHCSGDGRSMAAAGAATKSSAQRCVETRSRTAPKKRKKK